MDPTGGMGLWLLLGSIVAAIVLFFVLPKAWAIGIGIAVVGAVIALIVYVLSNARYT